MLKFSFLINESGHIFGINPLVQISVDFWSLLIKNNQDVTRIPQLSGPTCRTTDLHEGKWPILRHCSLRP